jgi:uncharacterized lipoprotein
VEEARGDAGLKALLLLGAAGLLIAGCGDDGGTKTATTSKADYERAFKAVFAHADRQPPIQVPEGASLRQQADGIEQGLERARALASALARLQPPDEVRHAHALFISGLRRFADDGEQIVAALRAGDEAEARKLLGPNGGALDPLAITQVTTARREFAAKGYDLGPVSRTP